MTEGDVAQPLRTLDPQTPAPKRSGPTSAAHVFAGTSHRSLLDGMTALDWVLSGLCCAFMMALCILRSRTRLLWADELLAYRTVAAPSFVSMMRGWYNGTDGGGGLYYILLRCWTHLFGLGDLSLRLYSTAGMCVALTATWAAARRYASTLVVALSVGVVYLTPAAMLWQEVNGRFYGQFLAVVAIASLLFLYTAEAEPTAADLLIVAVVHAGLVGSHILGMVYSFCLIAGMLACDALFRRRLRPRLYFAAAAAGCVVLLLSLHAVVASSSVAKGHFWTQTPRPSDLITGIAVDGHVTSWALLAVAAATLLRVVLSPYMRRHPWRTLADVQPPIQPPLFLCGSLVMAQLVLFAKSQTGTSIYADRYLLPVSVATVFLFCAGLRILLPKGVQRLNTVVTFSLSLLLLAPMAAYALARDINSSLYPPLEYARKVAAYLPPGQPVLATLPTYTLLTTYDPGHNYLFMLDWPYDRAPTQSQTDFSGEYLMENWRRAGFNSGGILNCPELFTQNPNLTLLLDFHRADWFRDRLEHNPAYRLENLGTYAGWWAPTTVWSVHRIGPGPLPC